MLDRFFAAFDYLLRCADYLGVQDKLLIYVKSDFGRTPQYNGNHGKDHYPVTSVMFMGPGITGNRVIGASDDKFNALKVNPQTLKLDDNGVYIQPEQLQMELRRVSGLGSHPLNAKYPIIGTPLTLLG